MTKQEQDAVEKSLASEIAELRGNGKDITARNVRRIARKAVFGAEAIAGRKFDVDSSVGAYEHALILLERERGVDGLGMVNKADGCCDTCLDGLALLLEDYVTRLPDKVLTGLIPTQQVGTFHMKMTATTEAEQAKQILKWIAHRKARQDCSA